jgi:3D (Asp-Asp-Asp) domain-containing protein
MTTHIRTWGIALIAVVAFAVPHLVTQADAIVPDTSAGTPAAASTLLTAVPNSAVVEVLNLKITAYSSSPDETKDYGSPFITADGTYVHDGVIATNLLPFGTKVMIPSLFGEKIFTVNDRMSKKLMNNLDIWMNSKASALVFGVHAAQVVVLQDAATMAISSKSQDPSVRQL